MRLPPRAFRRLVIDPLWVPVAAVLAAVLVVVLALAVLAAPFTRRRRVLRLTCLALGYLELDVWLMFACLGLWVWPPARRLADRDPGQWTARHVRLLRRVLIRLMSLSRRTLGFDLVVDPAVMPLTGDEPMVVLARHAGPGDSFSLVHLIIDDYQRTPRVVLKDVLQWDPGLDVILNRLAGCFLPSRTGAGDDTTDRIRDLALSMGRGDALLLFPEGANWTPRRHRRAVMRLLRSGRRRAARQAMDLAHVLPPRPAGTAAVLCARPDLDVVIVAHAGLDTLVSPALMWRALPLVNHPMRVHWWRVASATVPREEDEVAGWLNEQWAEVDRWVGTAPVGPPAGL